MAKKDGRDGKKRKEEKEDEEETKQRKLRSRQQVKLTARSESQAYERFFGAENNWRIFFSPSYFFVT